MNISSIHRYGYQVMMMTKIEYFDYKRQWFGIKLSHITTYHKSTYTFQLKSTSAKAKLKVNGKFIDDLERNVQRDIVKLETKVIDELLEHNRLRALHGSDPLILDEKLSKSAEKWAKHLAVVGK